MGYGLCLVEAGGGLGKGGIFEGEVSGNAGEGRMEGMGGMGGVGWMDGWMVECIWGSERGEGRGYPRLAIIGSL